MASTTGSPQIRPPAPQPRVCPPARPPGRPAARPPGRRFDTPQPPADSRGHEPPDARGSHPRAGRGRGRRRAQPSRRSHSSVPRWWTRASARPASSPRWPARPRRRRGSAARRLPGPRPGRCAVRPGGGGAGRSRRAARARGGGGRARSRGRAPRTGPRRRRPGRRAHRPDRHAPSRARVLAHLSRRRPVLLIVEGRALGRPLDPRPDHVSGRGAVADPRSRSSSPIGATTCTGATRCARCWPSWRGGRTSSTSASSPWAGRTPRRCWPPCSAPRSIRPWRRRSTGGPRATRSSWRSWPGPRPHVRRGPVDRQRGDDGPRPRGCRRTRGRDPAHRRRRRPPGRPRPARRRQPARRPEPLAGALQERRRQRADPQTPSDRYEFRHTLLHEAVYRRRPAGRTAPLPRQVRGADRRPLRRPVPRPRRLGPELARHRRAAGEVDGALAALIEAGLAAEAAHTPSRRRHFDSALELWDGLGHDPAGAPLDHDQLMGHAAEAASRTGSFAAPSP